MLDVWVSLNLLRLCLFVCVCVSEKSKAVSVWQGDQCNRSGFEMEGAVRPELDVKSFRQNVLCPEFIMCCFQGTDVCCCSCVCLCVCTCASVWCCKSPVRMNCLRAEAPVWGNMIDSYHVFFSLAFLLQWLSFLYFFILPFSFSLPDPLSFELL